jgi:hypothetical protein
MRVGTAIHRIMFLAIDSAKALAPSSHIHAISRGTRLTWGRGRVHSTFEHAINIECADAMVVLLEARHAEVPHGIRIASSSWNALRGLRPGDATVLSPTALALPRLAIRIELLSIPVWDLDLGGLAFEPAADRIRRVCETLRAGVAEHVRPAADALRGRYLERLSGLQPALAHALRRRDAFATARLLNRLIGLGCGLTPSGDDFIIGCLAGLALGACADAAAAAFVHELSEGLEIAHTTPVSRQQLRDACALRFARPLAQLAAAIALEHDVQAALASVLQVGAYSGGDAAAGLLAALEGRA